MSLRERVSEVRDRVGGMATKREAVALGVGTTGFVITASVALPVLGEHEQPIVGPDSLGQFAAVASAVTALVVFVGTWLLSSRRPLAERSLPGMLVDLVALAVAHAGACLLLCLALSEVAAQSFRGALVDPLPAAALAGGAAAVSGYFVFLSARGMDAPRLAGVLALILLTGTGTSMLTAANPLWWQRNLSALGMGGSLSAATFNLTLIVTGLVVTAIARHTTAVLSGPTRRVRLEAARWLLVVLGILLTCVGVFPVDRFFVLHNSVATSMVGVFLVITVGLRWLIPELPTSFVVLGLVFIGTILFASLLFAVGYFNLTAVELVAGVLIFSWLILFLRTVSATSSDLAASPAGADIGALESGAVVRELIDLTDLDDPAVAFRLGDVPETPATE